MKGLKEMLRQDKGWLLLAVPWLILVKVFDWYFLAQIGQYLGIESIVFFRVLTQEILISIWAGAVWLLGDMLLVSSFDKWFSKNLFALRLLPTFRMLVKIVGVLIWLVFTFQNFNINMSGIWTGAGVSGVVLAFAGKDAIANIFGGLTLLFSQKFQIGDSIRVKLIEGKIEKITISETTLISKLGHTIFVPNKLLLSEVIENLSMQPEKAVSVDFILNQTKYPTISEFLLSFATFTQKEADLKSLALTSRLVSLDSGAVRVFIEGSVPADTDIPSVQQKIMLFALEA